MAARRKRPGRSGCRGTGWAGGAGSEQNISMWSPLCMNTLPPPGMRHTQSTGPLAVRRRRSGRAAARRSAHRCSRAHTDRGCLPGGGRSRNPCGRNRRPAGRPDHPVGEGFGVDAAGRATRVQAMPHGSGGNVRRRRSPAHRDRGRDGDPSRFAGEGGGIAGALAVPVHLQERVDLRIGQLRRHRGA